jgi:hypothetical protein
LIRTVTHSKTVLDHDDFGSSRSKITNVIDSNILERDASGKPHHTFPHPALDKIARNAASPLPRMRGWGLIVDLKRFRAMRMPVRVKTTRHIKIMEPPS